MKNLVIVIVFMTCGNLLSLNAQTKHCGTMPHLERQLLAHPELKKIIEEDEKKNQQWIAEHWKENKKQGLNKPQPYITIPVVVHVVWHNQIENISDAQIQSQINALNEDFRLSNTDSLPANHPFWPYTADAQIEFCLAKRDPNGNPTNGITRTYTNITTFVGDGMEKHSATGGKDNWPPTSYLNLWVCNLDGSGGTLGYAQFPSSLSTNPSEDGVVIRYQSFGYIGTATAPYNLGRTGVHEIGHWLNLNHIWGDAFCGDDLVSDTEVAEEDNSGCPSFPSNIFNSCGSGLYGEMYMNYMDYVDDNCMNMFTYGQALRMNATLNGKRVGLFYSQGCKAPTDVESTVLEKTIEIFPNPSQGNFSINRYGDNKNPINIKILDVFGHVVFESKNIKTYPYLVNLNHLTDGIYIVQFDDHTSRVMKKITLSR